MVITIYKVYGCDTGGYPVLRGEFLDPKLACSYAVANYGKIHYNLPWIEKHTYCYDPEKQMVEDTMDYLKPEEIQQIAQT